MSEADRIMARTERQGECLIWTGAANDCRYGLIWLDSRKQYVHRVVYAAAHGPIPKGMHLDHLCRNTRCVALGHLELVTHGENIRRGYAHHRAAGTGRYASNRGTRQDRAAYRKTTTTTEGTTS